MPVKLRDNRRSLHINRNKITEFTKDAMRPKSWYLSNTPHKDIDPYTSVRKIFYEFPKKAFYGDSDMKDEIIGNGHVTIEDNKVSTENEKNLKDSFIHLNISKTPSPVASVKNQDEIDPNNNNSYSNKSKRSYFSSKNSDTSTLKEESSSYADMYVPNATKTSTNFLRRSYKRRSLDPTKFRDLISVQNHEDADRYSISSAISPRSHLKKLYRRSYDAILIQEILAQNGIKNSVLSSSENLSIKSQEKIKKLCPSFPKHYKPPINTIISEPVAKEESIQTNKLAPAQTVKLTTSNEGLTGNDMKDRFLHDTNINICEGVYPTAENTVIFEQDNIVGTLRLKGSDHFIPWCKRITHLETMKGDTITENAFANRRQSKRFSSLRSVKNKDLDSSFRYRRRSHSGAEGTLPPHFSLRRQHSEMGTLKRRRDSLLSLNRENSVLSQQEIHRYLKRRNKKMEAPDFFQGYQDKLREKMFTINVKKDCNPSSSLFKLYEYLQKAFEAKLLGKTYQQLFYIRSRLSSSAQKKEFLCDGYFGCDIDKTPVTVPPLLFRTEKK